MLALFFRLRAASRKRLQASRCSVYSGNSLAPVRCRVTTHCMGPVPGPGCSRNALRAAQGAWLGHRMETLLGSGFRQGRLMVPHAARLHQESLRAAHGWLTAWGCCPAWAHSSDSFLRQHAVASRAGHLPVSRLDAWPRT